MDTQFKTSFIPKKPIESSVNLNTSIRTPQRVGRTIFSLIGILVFVGTLAGYGATFAWQFKLKNDLGSQVASLEKTKKEFDEKFVQDASRLNTRIQQALSILDNHMAPSSLYALLEEYTLQTISFSRFSFKDNQDGTLEISGEGQAARYESIVLQSDSFGKSGFLRNVIFTNLRPDSTNQTVSFSFQATLDPRLVLYRNSLADINSQSN